MHQIRRQGARRRRGFTLVEVLVALLIMAILAGLAWRGLDGIVRARDGSNAVLDRTLRLNTVITQWEQDLQAVQETGAVPALSFDGQSLRLTRRVDGGVALVVWSLRGGTWQRWSAPTTTRVAELNDHWLRSQQLLGNETGQLNVAAASTWQVYFYRGNAWTNPQSTGNFAQGGTGFDGSASESGKDGAQGGGAGPGPGPGAGPSGAGSGGSGEPGPGGTGTGAGTGTGTGSGTGTGAGSGSGSGSGSGAGAPVPPAPPRELLPDAVRLVITLEAGTLTRDIALGPGGS